MRPGISIHHSALPTRDRRIVRCDIAAVISFIPEELWPEGASAGDFIDFPLRRWRELVEHPLRPLVEVPAQRAVRAFFENGGDEMHVYAVCVPDLQELTKGGLAEGVLAPLFQRLRCEDDIALLAVPSTGYWRCELLRNGKIVWDAEPLLDELLLHCRQMSNRFLIIDPPARLHGDLLLRWFSDFRQRDPITRAYGAIYYPWICRGDELQPPSGALMGVFARTEMEHAPFGVGWPPANTPVLGMTHTEVEMDWAEVGIIAEAGINPLVVQPGRGVVVWGARTLSTDPAWVFINSRRIVSMVTEQLRRDNEWAVFEPNTDNLWKVIERDVLVRLDQFWSAGLLGGSRAQAEYSVDCGRGTNPVEARDRGELNVRVALRPIGTTERILIDLRLGDSETG
jgi:uncharacterized protein